MSRPAEPEVVVECSARIRNGARITVTIELDSVGPRDRVMDAAERLDDIVGRERREAASGAVRQCAAALEAALGAATAPDYVGFSA